MPLQSLSSIPSISTPTPFKIEFGSDEVSDLISRISNARFPPAGVLPKEKDHPFILPRTETLREWAEEWKNMDFKQVANELNAHEHFKTKIDWCDLHFVHRRSSRADAIPLIMIHGWPGSFHEFHHLIGPLAEPQDENAPAFHVVVPSLPGFCYSSAPPTKALANVDSYSRVMNALMFGLGYERYAVQGGDWGSCHARALGSKFQFEGGKGCKAVHLNFCPVGPGSSSLVKLSGILPTGLVGYIGSWLPKDQQVAIQKGLYFKNNSSSYYDIQRNRPSQLAPGLIDSPIGLLSWIGHFFIKIFADPSSPKTTLNLQSVLVNISLYWFTASIGTSFLPYASNQYLSDIVKDPEYYIRVPFAFSGFPNEISDSPAKWVENTGELKWWSKATKGGHFAALEVPEIFTEHVRNAFAKGGKMKGFNTKGGIKEEGLLIKGGIWDLERKESRDSKL